MIDSGYEEKTGKYFAGQRLEMVGFVPVEARTILEIGCGTGGFSAYLKSQREVHITGIEAFPEAAATAATKIDRVLHGPVEVVLSELDDTSSFDCVVMNDVLEHLVDPWAVLRSLHRVLTSGGFVVASIPNVRYFPVLKEYFMEGQWQYRDEGVMDRTHLRFFTQRSIRGLFTSTNYKILKLEGINGIKQFPWKFGLLNALARQAFDDTRFKQFACVAQTIKAADSA